MARMLQALKNLEARSAWPPAGAGLLAHLAESPAPVAPRTPNPPKADPPKPEPPPPEPPKLEPKVEVPAPPLPPEPAPPIFEAPAALPPLAAPAFQPTPDPLPPARPTTRPPTGVERAVRRTLGEPHRRQPLADIAARLRQDAHQTGSRTLVLLAIGGGSSTHDAALHLAALLVDEGGKILLIDGDPARRQLSADMDQLQACGLSDLATAGVRPSELIQPTAFAGLGFLPAGSQRFADLRTAADPLARAFGQFAADFDLVLLSAGRVDDPGAAVLARMCDAAYVLVELGAVEAGQAQRSLRELRGAGARVLGCIAVGDAP
jgi:Mrp family chromosome partitioning ATPase